MTGSLLLDIAYGLEVKRKNDPIITIAEKAEFAVAQAGNAGAYLVDLIPIRCVILSSLYFACSMLIFLTSQVHTGVVPRCKFSA